MNGENDFSRLELNLSACENNYHYFRGLLNPETKLLVLVKANAYGHGAVEFASMMQRLGADYLAVALPVEGIELRKAGISLPILVLTAGTDYMSEIIDYRLEPGIPNLSTLAALEEKLEEKGISEYPIHLKLDTGMHRLGFMEDELDECLDFLAKHPRIQVKSVYSHLAAAEDPESDDFTLAQIELFTRMAEKVSARCADKPMWHILNSAGIERFTSYQFDMVRLGIGIYGISALKDVHLMPVASFKVKILQLKHLLPKDGAIGYGRKGRIAPDGTTIATIPAGYADGVDRHLGRGAASFNVKGHRAPTIGNICMDMCMLDVTGLDVQVGDTVTIFGEDPRVEELAEILGTIPYEILSSIPHRIERIIIK